MHAYNLLNMRSFGCFTHSFTNFYVPAFHAMHIVYMGWCLTQSGYRCNLIILCKTTLSILVSNLSESIKKKVRNLIWYQGCLLTSYSYTRNSCFHVFCLYGVWLILHILPFTASEFGMGDIKAWCISNAKLFTHALVISSTERERSSECRQISYPHSGESCEKLLQKYSYSDWS